MDWPALTTTDDAATAWAAIPALCAHLDDLAGEAGTRTPADWGRLGHESQPVASLRALRRRLQDAAGLPGVRVAGATPRAYAAGLRHWDAGTEYPSPDEVGGDPAELTIATVTAERGPLWGASRLFWTAHRNATEARAGRASHRVARTTVRAALATQASATKSLADAWTRTGQDWAAVTADAAAFIASHDPQPVPGALTQQPARVPIRLRTTT